VDEFRLYVHPVLIGRGKRLFQESESLTGLRLVETRNFDNGVVLLRYALDHAADTSADTGANTETETDTGASTAGASGPHDT
jgi:hypothetical protein